MLKSFFCCCTCKGRIHNLWFIFFNYIPKLINTHHIRISTSTHFYTRKLPVAGIAQLGERQTEDLKVTCSIHVHRTCVYTLNIHKLSYKRELKSFVVPAKGHIHNLWFPVLSISKPINFLDIVKDKENSVFQHSEMCMDCHNMAKLVSKLYDRGVTVRDRTIFHHFTYGLCLCKEYY